MTDQFYRRTTESPYGPRILRLLDDAGRYGADLLWLEGQWWLVLPLFPTYRGVRFRVVGNRLHLLPAVKDPRHDNA